MSERDPYALDWIDAYIGLVVDAWGIKIDHEDGSTAPFTARAAEMIE